jgi:hypothetical protein
MPPDADMVTPTDHSSATQAFNYVDAEYGGWFMTSEAGVPDLWALDRIEEIASPYHDWQPDDRPLLPGGVALRATGAGIEIVRRGTVAGRMSGEPWLTGLADRLGPTSAATAAELAAELGVPVARLAEALQVLERLGVVRTALAEQCASGTA